MSEPDQLVMADQTVKRPTDRALCQEVEAEFLKAQNINKAYNFQEEFC